MTELMFREIIADAYLFEPQTPTFQAQYHKVSAPVSDKLVTIYIVVRFYPPSDNCTITKFFTEEEAKAYILMEYESEKFDFDLRHKFNLSKQEVINFVDAANVIMTERINVMGRLDQPSSLN